MVSFDILDPLLVYVVFNLVTFAAIGLIFAKRAFLRRHRRKVLFAAAALLVYTQFLRYGLPLLEGTFSFGESLPLFTCRITSPILLYYALTEDERVEGVLFFLGGTGIMGVFIPTGPIQNITGLTEYFFIDHFLLGMTPFYLITVKDFVPSYRQAVVIAVLFGFAMLAFIPVNLRFSTDYFHWRDMQFAQTIVPAITPFWFTMFLTLALFFFFNLYYALAKKCHASLAPSLRESARDVS